MDPRNVYFHEDDYGQIEVLPVSNWDFCARQIGEINTFSEQHRAPGGMGWTDVFMQKEEPAKLASLTLGADVVSRALSQDIPKFDRVTTGYSSHVEECRDTLAFGFDRDCVIFISTNEANAVSNIWLGLGGPGEAERGALLAALRSLSAFSSLLLVDWAWGRLFLLDDEIAISQYLVEREIHMNKVCETIRQRRLQEAEEKVRQEAFEKRRPRRWWQIFRGARSPQASYSDRMRERG